MEKTTTNKQKSKPVIGISIGDFNGVGPEVIMKALTDQRIIDQATFVIYGSTKIFSYYRKNYRLDSFNYSQVKTSEGINPKTINIITTMKAEMGERMLSELTEEEKENFIAILEKITFNLTQQQVVEKHLN